MKLNTVYKSSRRTRSTDNVDESRLRGYFHISGGDLINTFFSRQTVIIFIIKHSIKKYDK